MTVFLINKLIYDIIQFIQNIRLLFDQKNIFFHAVNKLFKYHTTYDMTSVRIVVTLKLEIFEINYPN